MEAHIKGHANEIPDEEGGDSSSFSVDVDTIKMEKSVDSTGSATKKVNKNSNILPETPIESSSEANSDGDELVYYNNMYSRYEQSNTPNNSYPAEQPSVGVNPALLAAVSMVTSSPSVLPVTNMEVDDVQSVQQPHDTKLHMKHESIPSGALLANSFTYEPLAIMRQQGYFAPKVEEYR